MRMWEMIFDKFKAGVSVANKLGVQPNPFFMPRNARKVEKSLIKEEKKLLKKQRKLERKKLKNKLK